MPWKNYNPVIQMPQWYSNVSNDGIIIPTTTRQSEPNVTRIYPLKLSES